MASSMPIDIIIPVNEKDLANLPIVITCAKKNIINPVETVFIVAKPGHVQDFCAQINAVFVDEDTILPLKKTDIKYQGEEWYRSGWLFQQLIKLSADSISTKDYFLVLDADTCIARPQSFVQNDGRMLLNFSDEYHFPYGNLQRFVPLRKRFFLSFVCHHMLMSRLVLQNLRKSVQQQTGKKWYHGILDNIDLAQPSCFSEYELYGNFLYYNYPGLHYLEYWKNKASRCSSPDPEFLEKKAGKYKSVSFHK